jgi:hypothetical protein
MRSRSSRTRVSWSFVDEAVVRVALLRQLPGTPNRDLVRHTAGRGWMRDSSEPCGGGQVRRRKVVS